MPGACRVRAVLKDPTRLRCGEKLEKRHRKGGDVWFGNRPRKTPKLSLSGEETDALVAYMQTLKKK